MDAERSVKFIQSPEGPNISLNGRLLYSDTSTPEKRVEGLPQTSETLYLIISPLLFRGVEKLLQHIPEDSHVAAIEHDEDLYSLSLDYINDYLPECDYRSVSSPGDCFAADLIQRYRCRRIVPVKLNRGYMINRKFYDGLLGRAETFLKDFWKNRMTTIHMGRLWCRNIILNAASLPAAAAISELRTEKPVFCVGAGESLEGCIGFLKENRGVFFITAADTAVSALLANGIKPDLVIALEAQHANLYDFYGSGALDLPAAVDLTSSPELIRKLRGPRYFFVSEFGRTSVFSRLAEHGLLPPMIPPLGSVGISALQLSLILTRAPVFFAGLDFSFTPDKYHAAGSPSHIISGQRENRFTKLPFTAAAYSPVRVKETDKSGRTVYTDLLMKSYSETLNSIIQGAGLTFDCGNVGLPSAAGHIDLGTDSGRAVALRAAGAAGTDSGPNRGSECDSGPARDSSFGCAYHAADAAEFLKGELSLIDRAIESTVEFQNTRNSGDSLPGELERLLLMLDYIWLFFPDKGPLPSADSSFLKRFLFSASWFRGKAANALESLGQQS